jgi:hypothetical protein
MLRFKEFLSEHIIRGSLSGSTEGKYRVVIGTNKSQLFVVPADGQKSTVEGLFFWKFSDSAYSQL